MKLIEVFWDESARQYTVFVRSHEDNPWSEYSGDEHEVDTLLNLARDTMTGG